MTTILELAQPIRMSAASLSFYLSPATLAVLVVEVQAKDLSTFPFEALRRHAHKDRAEFSDTLRMALEVQVGVATAEDLVAQVRALKEQG